MNNSKSLFNSYLTLAGFNEARVLHVVQGDKTPLTFELKDRNKEVINLPETTGIAQIIDSKTEVLKALPKVTVTNGVATFVLDEILPVADYEVYIKINEQYFPSTSDSFIIRVVEAYDVVDAEESDLMTIDIVVDAMRDDVIAALAPQVEAQVSAMIEADPEKFRGEKGDAFTFEDFTDEQWQSLKGETGDSLTFDMLNADQQEAIRGHSAYKVAVDNGFSGTEEEWIANLKGEKGDTGDSAYEEAVINGFIGSEAEWLESLNGKDGTVAYSDLDESQKADLRIPPKIYTRDEYSQLTEIDPNTLYFIEGV